MEQEILKSIQEVVDKNLPAQMGESFKRLFNEAEENKAALKRSIEASNIKDGQIKELQAKVAEYKSMEERFYALFKREEEIGKREKDMDLHDLKKDLTCSEKKFDVVHNLVSQLTRNTIFRETTFENDHMSSYYTNNNGEVREKLSSSKNSTREAE